MNWRITAKGLERLEKGLQLADARTNRLGMKLLEILARDGEMSVDECIRKAMAELASAPKAPTKDLS